MPQKQTKSLTVRDEEIPQCHIHDDVDESEMDEIHLRVCVNEIPLTEHLDGKKYCLFHLPTEKKDSKMFLEIFNARLNLVDEEIWQQKNRPEDEQNVSLSVYSYDFHYVWFPCEIHLSNRKFEAKAYFPSTTFIHSSQFDGASFTDDTSFHSANFSGYTSFADATFSAKANFIHAKFVTADFIRATFSGDASFNSSNFSRVALFGSATFSEGAYFGTATFSDTALFSLTTFSGDSAFNAATFYSNASFGVASFLESSQIFFQKTVFHGSVDFNYAVLVGYVTFEGDEKTKVFTAKKEKEDIAVGLNLQNARLEKPERISFHRVQLCPSWFINVDSREMVFTDIKWDNLDSTYNNSNIKAEITGLEKRGISEPSRLLEIACRQLAANAEENNRYEEASKFRYMAMETKRLEYKWQGRFWTLNWWYRLSSGYGESWKRAAVVLLGVLVLFGLLYASPLSKFDYGEKKEIAAAEQPVMEAGNDTERFHHMGLFEGAVHSLYVSALQRPEPKAANTLTKFFVIMETILGPLQAALLALAIRRKFMR